ncbi:MAG: Ig-like domain-containing protein, partial [Gammaproteobacteria bacterium]|nr:Ig-like domain-containing protein [Gammaproteobacteria bacterium]
MDIKHSFGWLCVCVFGFFLYACGGGAPKPADSIGRLEVVSTYPDSNEADIPVEAEISVKFNRDIDLETLSAATYSVMDMRSHQVVVGTIRYEPATYEAFFKPLRPLQYGLHYHGVIHHKVKDKQGTHLGNTDDSFEWRFSTQQQPPKLFFHEPRNGQQNVSIHTRIHVQFETAMDAASFDNSTFYLQDNNQNLVNVRVTYQDQHAMLEPVNLLLANTTYTAVVSANVKSASDVQLGNEIRWSFTTAPDSASVKIIGTRGNDEIKDMVFDPVDQSYIVVGNTEGKLGEQRFGAIDIFLTKLDANMQTLWVQQIGAAEFDSASGVTLTANGSICFTGYTDGVLAPDAVVDMHTDVIVACYDRNGNHQWIKQIPGGNGSIFAHAISAYGDNQLLIT